MKQIKIIDITVGSRKFDGTHGDIAILKCPCGHEFKEDIYDCPTCEAQAIAGTMDCEIECLECHGLYSLNHKSIVVHCPADYETDCGVEL